MAKKTWIKVKRGLLDPKHIEKLGQAWYLYIYILDQADWGTGTIKEWKDEYAANDLDKPIGLIREHRKKLIEEKYIACEKNQHSQKIIIHNWTDPRRYNNHLLNPKSESMEKDELWDEEKIESKDQSDGQSVFGCAINPHSSYNHIITYSHKNIDPLIENFISLSGIEPPRCLEEINRWTEVLTLFQRSGVTDEIIIAACEEARKAGKIVSGPESIITECTKLINKKIAS